MPIPHVTLVNALSINNLGQILASGIPDAGHWTPESFNQTYLLTSSSLGEADYGVPEPSTLAFFGLAFAIAWLPTVGQGLSCRPRQDRQYES